MKAAVLHQFGATPRYEDFPDPVAGADELLIHVKAVTLENVDRATANGTHFASRQFFPTLPAIVGFDGIGMLDDGRLIGFGGMKPPYGAMAELAVIPKAYFAPIPEGIAAEVAASVPGSALTALFPLKYGTQIEAGQTVLINGATGFAGRLAVQIARLLGAGRVVGTGRNGAALEEIQGLGASEVIDLKLADSQAVKAIRQAAGDDGYHVILDFLWGHPTELILQALTPTTISFARHKIRLIQAGEMAGSSITLAADALRTSGLEIVGAGAGLTPEAIAEGSAQVWDWIRAGKLSYDIETMPLAQIERAWERTDVQGKRLVVTP